MGKKDGLCIGGGEYVVIVLVCIFGRVVILRFILSMDVQCGLIDYMDAYLFCIHQ